MSGPRGAAPRREDHELFDELAVGWALHALEPEEETLFAAHLPECPRCVRTVAETSEVMGALASDLPAAEPSEGLRARLRAAVEHTEQVTPGLPPLDGPADPFADEEPPAAPAVPAAPAAEAPRPPERPATGFPGYRPPGGDVPLPAPSPWRRVLPNALAAAAVAVILCLGTWNVLLATSRDEARAVAAEQAEIMEALLRPGQATIAPLSDDDGSPVATVVARTGQVQVVTHGLSVNDDEDEVYVVWGIGEGPPVALGTFDVVSTEMDLRTVGSASTGLDGYATYGISIEPGRQAPSAPTVIVATGQVTS
ncbi:MAG TPA: anti-sigma factor [Geodermatophilus sp.]|nr:anti-sigma factor [Geodermatophilus sp.]